jgi:putative hydrolase of the HAD superfamily
MPADAAGRSVVVFDVDDTLYLERDYVASGFAAVDDVVRATFGVAGFQPVAWRLFLAGRRGDVFDRALVELGVPATPADITRLVGCYRRHRPRISLLPDAAGVLADLRRCGVGLAVLTDGPAESQSAKVDALGLAGLVDQVVLTGAYGGGYGKPHPRGYREIAERSGAVRLAYVADNPAKDFVAPHDLGWTTIRARRPGGLHRDVLHGGDVDVAIDDLGLLRDALAARGFAPA